MIYKNRETTLTCWTYGLMPSSNHSGSCEEMLCITTVVGCQPLLHVILITEAGSPKTPQIASNYRIITSLRLLLYVAFPPWIPSIHGWKVFAWMGGICVDGGVCMDGRNFHSILPYISSPLFTTDSACHLRTATEPIHGDTFQR